MDSEHELLLEDCFAVRVKPEPPSPERVEEAEEEEIMCVSQAEAERIRHELHRQGRSCVIRYIGPAGGGD